MGVWEKAESVFGAEKQDEKDDSKEKELCSKIGELQVQVDFLKNFRKMTLAEKRDLVSPEYKPLSVSAQCSLLELPHSCFYFYFKPKGTSTQNQQLMKAIDRKFLECPLYGVDK